MPQILFFLGALFFLPLVPILIWQGKKVRENIPPLPEADGPRLGLEDDSTSNEKVELLLLGESTMAGVGVKKQKEGLGRFIAKHLKDKIRKPIQWQVIARSGFTAEQVEQELCPQIPKKKFDLIVIALGGNDTFQIHSPKKWLNSIKKLIATLRTKQKETPIVLINMPPVGEFPAFTKLMHLSLGNLVKLHGMAVRQLVGQLEEVYYIDQKISYKVWASRLDNPSSAEHYYSDGVHPTSLSYQLWAEEIATFIAEKKLC